MELTAKVALQKYPAYKDSGVEWLGEIPEHWDVKRFRNMFNLFKGLNITKENLLDEGVPCINYGEIHSKYGFEVDPNKHKLKCVEFHYFESSSKSLLMCGDFVFADTSEDIEGSGNFTCLVSDEKVFAGYHTIIARILENQNYRYISFYFDSNSFRNQIRKAVKGVKVYSITNTILKNTSILLPPLDIQIEIANFLDQKTSQIDKAIAQKEKLIELLKERKQIIIQNAVTGKVVWNAEKNAWTKPAKVKDSGVEWIGEIPEGWEVKRLKYLGKIRYGLGQPPKERENGLPIIRATNVERGKIIKKGLVYVDPFNIPWDRNPQLKKDEIIVVRSGAYTGDSAIVTDEYHNSIAGYDMIFTPLKADPKFISYALLSHYVVYNQLYLLRMRAAQPHLNAEELAETVVLVPKLKEQIKIVFDIERQSAKIDKAIAFQQTQIQKLKEYKATLIDSAVTGKIKVV